jgi:signal transduction histidine kinase
LKIPEIVGMFKLFAELIAKDLDANKKLASAESALLEEHAVSDLREQFIAVLGHDLRTPMRSISCLTEVLLESRLDESTAAAARLIRESALRMAELIDNMLDLARSRLGG